MKLIFKIKSLVSIILFVANIFPSFLAANDNSVSTEKQKVLLLNSYHRGYLWSDQITNGIESVLGKYNNIELDIEYLDSKRHADTYLNETHFKYLKDKYSIHKFDAVITSDDDAFNFIKQNRNELFGNIPVVFTGVNYFKKEYINGFDNCTGVNEQVDIEKNINLIHSIHPQTKNILIITDNTTTGKSVQEEIKRINRDRDLRPLKIRMLYDVSKQELEDTLNNLKDGTVVLFTVFANDKNGLFLEYDEGPAFIAKNCSVPLYGIWSFSLGYGIIGGWLTDGYYQGTEAAEKALKILSGTPAGEIPIAYNTPTTLYFDYNNIIKHNVDESKIPENAILINKPATLIEEYKQVIWIVVTLLVFLIIAVLGISYGYFRSRQAEKQVRSNGENLRITLNSIGEAVISTDVKGRIVQMNPVAEKLTGWNFYEAEGKDLSEVFRIMNPVTGLLVENPVEKVLANGMVVGLANHTKLTSRSGEEYQIADTASSIKDDAGNVSGVVLVFRNVTEEYRIKEALKESEETFRSIIEASPMGLHIYRMDENDKLIFIGTNPAANKLLNTDCSKFIGKKIDELFPQLMETGIIERYQRAARTGEPWSGELAFPGENGKTKIYEIYVFQMIPMKTAILFNDITERKEMEEALRQSETRFRDMAEMLPEVILETDKELNIIYANQKAQELYRTNEDDHMGGINLTEFLMEGDLERAKQNHLKRLNGEHLGVLEYTAKRKDGSLFPILFNFNPIYSNGEITGFRGLIVDISDRKKSESRIQRRLDFEEILFKYSYKLINSHEDDWDIIIHGALKDIGQFSQVKRACLFKFSPEENIVINTHEWCSIDIESRIEDSKNIPINKIPNIISTLKNSGELYIRNVEELSEKWDSEKQIFKIRGVKNVMIISVAAEGTLLGFLCLDHSQKSEVLDREYVRLLGTLGSIIGAVIHRKNQHKELLVSKERAEHSDKLKSEFLAQVSHEIRTPVNSILSFAGLLNDLLADDASADVQESLLSMNNSGRRIIRTIDLIINMSQVQTGTYDLNPRSLNICEDIIQRLVKEYEQLAADKNILFAIVENTEALNVFADEYTVSQIIHNLLDNAIKFTPEGKVEVLLNRDENNNLTVSIADTGIGIGSEYLPHIFEAFSQEEQGYTRRFDGNGLGLALVKNYCDLNGIEIKVESEKGKGSKFTIVFPNMIHSSEEEINS